MHTARDGIRHTLKEQGCTGYSSHSPWLCWRQDLLRQRTRPCADQTSIIDDFAPHEWHGAGACAKWISDFQVFAKSGEFTDSVVTIGKPWHIDATADFGYVVAPTTFTFKQKGKPTKENAVLTMSLQKSASGWRITGWAWADH